MYADMYTVYPLLDLNMYIPILCEFLQRNQGR